MPSSKDMINPNHYKESDIEVIDIIEGFELNYHIGNAVKYLLRAHLKNQYKQDLEKAKWYLNRQVTSNGADPYSNGMVDFSVEDALEGRKLSPYVHLCLSEILYAVDGRRSIKYEYTEELLSLELAIVNN